MTNWTSVCEMSWPRCSPRRRVVQPCHGGTGQARTAQRKDVLGGVVQQEADVGGTVRVEPGAVQRSEALRFGQKLAVGPSAVAEAQGRTVGIPGIRAVATQERRRVRRQGAAPRPVVERALRASLGVPRRSEPRPPRRPSPPPYLAPSRPPITMTDHSLFTLSPRSRRKSTTCITANPARARSIEAATPRPPVSRPSRAVATRPHMARPCRFARGSDSSCEGDRRHGSHERADR